MHGNSLDSIQIRTIELRALCVLCECVVGFNNGKCVLPVENAFAEECAVYGIPHWQIYHTAAIANANGNTTILRLIFDIMRLLDCTFVCTDRYTRAGT